MSYLLKAVPGGPLCPKEKVSLVYIWQEPQSTATQPGNITGGLKGRQSKPGFVVVYLDIRLETLQM